MYSKELHAQIIAERKREEILRKDIKLIQEGIEKNREEIRLLSQQIDDKVNANVTMNRCINALKAEADKIAEEPVAYGLPVYEKPKP